jgi:hypothetical protein
MTSSFDPVPDPDDRPATVASAAAGEARPAGVSAAPVPYRPRPSRWAMVFRWWLALSVLTFFGVALCVFLGLAHSDFAPLHIVVDDDLSNGITINGLSEGGRALLVAGLGLLALLLLLLIPLVILLVAGSVAIALVCGVGVPLIVLALALGVATSPFWMVGLLVWLMLRRRDSHRAVGSATMAA